MRLARALEEPSVESLATCLVDTLRAAGEAARGLAGTGLRVGLETLGLADPVSLYVALAPQPGTLAGPAAAGPTTAAERAGLLAPVLARIRSPLPLSSPEVAAQVRAVAGHWCMTEDGEALVDLLAKARNRAD